MSVSHVTSLVIFLPLVGALITLLLRGDNAIKLTALITTTATFLLSLVLFSGFDATLSTATGPQLVDVFAWLPGTDIKYFVGIDGLNVLLVLLTTLLGPIVVLSSWNYIGHSIRGYYALILILQTGVTGVFCSFVNTA